MINNMKKNLLTLAALLCCTMTTTVFTACTDDDDNSVQQPETNPDDQTAYTVKQVPVNRDGNNSGTVALRFYEDMPYLCGRFPEHRGTWHDSQRDEDGYSHL